MTGRARVAEQTVRRGALRRRVRLRVDLHGVSVFGPGPRRTLIRWEWITDIRVDDGVVVRSATAELRLPPGTFGRDPPALAEQLADARSIQRRAEVIGRLAAG